MTEHEHDPLPPELAELLAAARPLDEAPATARERLLHRMTLSAGALPGDGGGPGGGGGPRAESPPAPPASALSPLAQKVAIALSSFVVGGVVGAAVVLGSRTDEPASRVVVAAEASAPSAPSAALPSVPAVAATDLPSVPAHAPGAPARAATASGSASPANEATTSDLAEERRLLDAARGALLRGEPASAIAPLDEHGRRFSRGALAEEREALAVQALARGGRAGEAADRAARFRKAYPSSFMTPAVDNAIESTHDN